MKKLLLGLALSATLAACQPLAPAAPTPTEEAGEAFLVLPEAHTERGVLPRDRDLLVLTQTGQSIQVPLQYDRSLVETLVWEGDGAGVAELHNAHGQLLYRVEEGQPAQTVTVGAGKHTLTIRGAVGDEVASRPLPEGASSQLRRFERLDDMAEAAGAEAEARGWGGPGNSRCMGLQMYYMQLASLERRWQEYKLKPTEHDIQTYVDYRSRITLLLMIDRDRLESGCPELLKHLPPQRPPYAIAHELSTHPERFDYYYKHHAADSFSRR